jgi:hypothetical protein
MSCSTEKERQTASPFLFNIRRNPLPAGRLCHGAELRLNELGIPTTAAYRRGGDGDQRGPG